MTLLCLKTHDLSWQDRTLNIELMMAPNRSQLLYNKHKGLNSKCQQEKSYLEREKISFLRSYETDRRMMERKKERYAKSRHTITQRRMSSDRSRTPDNDLGRNSAPPRLEGELSKGDNTFLTQVADRQSQSAGAGRHPKQQIISQVRSKLTLLTPTSRRVSPEVTTRDTTSADSSRRQPPYLGRVGRQKSVRFLGAQETNKTVTDEQTVEERTETPIEDRIKKFLEVQSEFNNRRLDPLKCRGTPSPSSSCTSGSIAKRYSGLQLKVSELELAFDKFCDNSNTDSYHKLIRYASKMKANIKNARNASLVPTMASLRGKNVFRTGTRVPQAWTTAR